VTVELTGQSLTLDEVVRVARSAEHVAIAPDARERVGRMRDVVLRAAAEGTKVYGVTTGVGMRRDAAVTAADARAFNRSAIFGHLVALGPPASEDVVRASLLRLANGVVAGYRRAGCGRARRGAERRRHSNCQVARHASKRLAQNADRHGALGAGSR
jgi:histidine ammonia-lyase